jgi:hypothetical protein
MVALASAAAPQAQTLQCADLSDVAPLENVRFEQDVLPIFEDQLLDCSSCHGGSGGLSLDQGVATHQELFCVDTEASRPQPAGKRVVPGAPMESWLYLRIACDDPNDPGFRMPRNEWLPTTNQLRTIYDWILQGAPSAEMIFKSRFDTRGYCPP